MSQQVPIRTQTGRRAPHATPQATAISRAHNRPSPATVRRKRRLVLNDFAGHAFTLDLAEGLVERGHPLGYAYCNTFLTPQPDFTTTRVDVHPISTGSTFEKYGIVRRLVSEVRYGIGSAVHLWRCRADVVIANNMPLGSLAVIWLATRARRAVYVVWLQDVTSGLVASVLGPTSLVARLTRRFESFILRRSDRLIAISPSLARRALDAGLDPGHIVVLENWPTLRLLPLRERENPWAKQHDLGARPVVLYCGTLAKKHAPDRLTALADALPDVDVVVVSEGDGADWLASELTLRPRANLRLLPFQHSSDLPDVLASADVLLAVLNPAASPHSVPSKILSYLCAGRPVLASMPRDNLAARIIAVEAEAGIVVEPSDIDGLVAAASRLLTDDELRSKMGAQARDYAERTYQIDAVVRRFIDAVGLT